MNKKALIIAYGYVFSEPPSRNTMLSLLNASFDVSVIHLQKHSQEHSYPIKESIETFPTNVLAKKVKILRSIFEWNAFKEEVNKWIVRNPGSLIWACHLTPLAAVNFTKVKNNNCYVITNIVDIPSEKFSGKFDRILNRAAFKKLVKCAFLVASDFYKGNIAKKKASLNSSPIICHNCPRIEEFNTFFLSGEQKNWLKEELIKYGASVSVKLSFILLRAGAIGEFGGIEETIDAMNNLPPHFVFLMMGRPEKSYEQKVRTLIDQKNLGKRVFLWVKPSDEIWTKTLLGADVGHLIHICPPSGPQKEIYELNSSLSNNRLFQYMGAGLPIISYNDPRMEGIYKETQGFCKINAENIAAEIMKVLFQLEADEKLRHQLGNNNREAFLKKYNWDNQFQPIYSRIVLKK